MFPCLTWIDEGVIPVSVPKIDGGRQYIFRRSDLEQAAHVIGQKPKNFLTFSVKSA